MKSRLLTLVTISLLAITLYGGDLDGLWRSSDQNRSIEIMYTTNGIKARSGGSYGTDWISYDQFETNRYRDGSGNCLSLSGSLLEWCTADRRKVINYSRSNAGNLNGNDGKYTNDPTHNNQRNYDTHDHNLYHNDQYNTNVHDDRWNDSEYGRPGWNKDDRINWNNFYQVYEGKWHNHTTGQRIQVDLTRRSLRIKFTGEGWFEVFERNRGLFVDQKGNEFVFNGDNITYHSNDGDLTMRFYNDDRCVHPGDFRSEYWRN